MCVDDQADAFMRAFLTDFAGNFEEVLDAAAKYKAALVVNGKPDDGSGELSAMEAALFLEDIGFVQTASELKECGYISACTGCAPGCAPQSVERLRLVAHTLSFAALDVAVAVLRVADLDNNGHLSFVEFALLRYGKDAEAVVNGPPFEKLHPGGSPMPLD
jgi:hypothetical protein